MNKKVWEELQILSSKVTQRQDSLVDQLIDLRKVAILLGMYDGADFIKNTINSIYGKKGKKIK